MKTRRAMLVLGVMSLLAVPLAAGPNADCGHNAALGYWMAMAQMENTDASAELAAKLERTARGAAAWDEKLSPVVDANRDAVETMHRASRLPFCDWGVEYSRNAEAPLAHLVRARALARLNILYGMQLAQRGRAKDAALAWASGLRFSRDIAAGAPLLGAIYAANQMQLHLRALEEVVVRKQLPPDELQEIERVVSSLPEDGFDWGAAVEVELSGLMGFQESVLAADDPRVVLQRLVGQGDSASEKDRAVAAYLGVPVESLANREAIRAAVRRGHAAMAASRPKAVAAFRLPHAKSVPALRELVAQAKTDPTLAQGWPSLIRANEELRGGVVKARASLLATLRRP